MAPIHPRIVLRTRPSSNIISSKPFQQRRSFHPTRPSPFINEALDISSSFLHGVHDVTGLPWAASIPLTALIVRMTVGLPLQIYTRIHARRNRDLSPLLLSWRKVYQDQIMAKAREEKRPLLPFEAEKHLQVEMAKRQRTLRKRWKAARFHGQAAFLQIPIWLSLMESLRAMCGNNSGLVPWLLSLMESGSADPSQYQHLKVEESLASEGALWFPDLLAGDPTGILPLMLAATIWSNVSLGWKTPTFKELADFPRTEMVKQGVLKTIKIFIQFMAINIGINSYVSGMPTGLMIYWITSANIATLQTAFLNKYMFSKAPLKPWMKMHVGLRKVGEAKPEKIASKL
ncbi:mitochondrial export translocase Oxa2, putative [Paecilomyces variotii No. 5]|uniref:Mitochondrial export translocase Oxa2, putative n=1 Tax=Byssochlamys spectabilis (strain No. 5 / NBRC 109023) TaxID=1356009 RepID=V5FX97_BYSSN|nr:mitochondrial export translocase Oxa2, putative [Paecilomyces variotii No. 5]